MGTLERKIESLKQDVRHLNTWGFELGACRLLMECFTAEQRKKSRFLQRVAAKKDILVEKEIEQYCPEVLQDKSVTDSQEVIPEDCPIWVFWYQDLSEAPDIVKACFKSVHENRGKHPVILINKENLADYVKLPDYVLEKLKAGKMTITHFSDILRFALLYEHGGIWMDATIYLSRTFDEEMYDYPLYTIRFKEPGGRRWTSFFWASAKKNESIGFLLDYFYNYWQREDGLIDYFLINAIIGVSYRKNSYFRNQLDRVPPSNSDVTGMFEQLNRAVQTLQVREDTYIHKLSYKRNWQTHTPSGELTVYGQLMLNNQI